MLVKLKIRIFFIIPENVLIGTIYLASLNLSRWLTWNISFSVNQGGLHSHFILKLTYMSLQVRPNCESKCLTKTSDTGTMVFIQILMYIIQRKARHMCENQLKHCLLGKQPLNVTFSLLPIKIYDCSSHLALIGPPGAASQGTDDIRDIHSRPCCHWRLNLKPPRIPSLQYCIW